MDLAGDHAAARAGDADAMNRVILAFGRWVDSRSRRPPPMVDRDDAESMARESVWLAARRCGSPLAIGKFARSAYRFKVMTHQRSARLRVAAKHLKDWSSVAAAGVRFPAPPHADAAPCGSCGTRGGYTPPDQNRPKRVKGKCWSCAAADRYAAAAAG